MSREVPSPWFGVAFLGLLVFCSGLNHGCSIDKLKDGIAALEARVAALEDRLDSLSDAQRAITIEGAPIVETDGSQASVQSAVATSTPPTRIRIPAGVHHWAESVNVESVTNSSHGIELPTIDWQFNERRHNLIILDITTNQLGLRSDGVVVWRKRL